MDFINQTDLNKIQDKVSILADFYEFAQQEQKREAEELINEEGLNVDAAKRYILVSFKYCLTCAVFLRICNELKWLSLYTKKDNV